MNTAKLLSRLLFFQTVGKILPGFPIIGTLLLGLAAPAVAQTDYEKVSNAVHTVRLELEASLGKPVPSLSLLLQTPADTFFTCSAATPAQAVATNTSFRFASNTKNFTATAVLLLQQMGLLQITNRVVDWMPGTEEAYLPAGTNWAIPYKDRITIAQLLRHSAGVYDVDNGVVPGCGDDSYTSWMMEQDPTHQFTAEELAGQAARHQLSFFAPDEGYHYSNTGYTLLAEIVARVYSRHMGTPKTLSDFLYEQVGVGPAVRFPNLASDTDLPDPCSPGTEYYPSNVVVVTSNVNISAQVGEGNGYGTLPALNGHIRTLLKGAGVLNGESLQLMTTTTSPYNADYALGCTYWPNIGFGHNGSRVGNLSLMVYNPDTDVSLVVYLAVKDMSDGMTSFMACFASMYTAAGRALEALGYAPVPQVRPGQSTNLVLAAGATNRFYFTAQKDVYYGVHASQATAEVRLAIAPMVNPAAAQTFTNQAGWVCPAPGAYQITVHAAAATPAYLRLYTLTSTIARVSSLITNLMATHQLAGCGVSLVDGNQTVWQTGFGYADRERGLAADANTVFMIGSVSKTFGALAAMQLAEEGLLDLHGSITNALPSFAIHQRFADNIITPHTILTHHSGLPGDLFNQGFTVRPLPGVPDAVQGMLTSEYTLMPTNTMWAYNNSGFVMLSQMFRHLTGQELDVFARARLFDRMGMTNSSIAFDLPVIKQNRARPYVGGQICPDEYVNLFFAGAIYSTASDMARYMRMLLAGGMGENARVVSNQTLQAMATRQNAGIALDQYVSMLNMGIGFMLDPLSLQYMGKVIWHDGGTVYFRTLLRVATEAQLGCFISCNSYEGGAMNYTVVDSALQWAYEEKTGIAPPAPLNPGTPALAVAPPDVITLATGGVYVTSDGYDTFRYDGTNLYARLNAHSDEAPERAWVYRENGWFTPTNACAPQYKFVQAEGRILSVLQTFDFAVTNLILLGERSADVALFDPAWSNRLGRWWATDLHPDDIAWHGDELRLAWPRLQLTARDNLLLVQAENLYVMSATNDALAFAAGLGRNKGSSLRAAGPDALAFMGVTYRDEADIPQLAPGASTNGVTLGDEIQWFQIPAAASSLTFDLATEHDLAAYLYTQDDEYLGQANRAHAFQLAATNAQPVMAAVLRNGTNTGPWRLAVHTNTVPFYLPLSPQDWPADLIAHSTLYGNLEFGCVFVRENRTNPSGNLLKVAVAQMKSSLLSAQALLYCAGGPGSPSVVCAYQYYLKAFTNAYHVYLVDQRGIGHTQPWLEARTDEEPRDMQYRITRLEGGDLSALNTIESSLDFSDLALVFGLTNANLYGVSYGTLLAQTIMRSEPAWLRAVVLEGVMAPNIPPLSQTGPIRNDAVNALFADVAAHPQASAWYSSFPSDFYLLGTNLQDHPVPVEHGGRTNQMNGLTYLDQVLQQMTISDLGCRERIPSIVWRALRGETAALSELYTDKTDTNVFPPNVRSEMMQVMILKHDILPFDTMAAASNACANLPPLMRDLNLKFMQDFEDVAALFDPMGEAEASFTQPVTSAIPTLVMNGAYDTQTGTNWAAEVAQNLPNAYLVTVPAVGHCVLKGGDCPQQIIRDFLAAPWQAPDTTCLSSLALDFPPPWLGAGTNLALGQSVTNAVAQPNSGTWQAFTAVSGVVYAVQQSDGPRLTVLDALARPLATTDTALLEWESPTDGTYYLWTVAPSAGSYALLCDVPLLLRAMAMDGPQLSLHWQSYTNTTCEAWMTTNLLAPQNEHIRIATNLAAEGWFTTLHQPLATNTPVGCFYLRK